ncbi:MAG: radical SAM protein [Candidatus Magasanikbacteria bacterium]|jgi:uncharacterized protein|nr:radical SAM protein [Candidatus Magasanikbacteria bacterium]
MKRYSLSRHIERYDYSSGSVIFDTHTQETLLLSLNAAKQFANFQDNLDPESLDKTTLQALISAGLVQDSNNTCLKPVEHSPAPQTSDYTLLRILLTDLCNLDCRYCKVEKNIKTITQTATSLVQLEKAISLFFDSSVVNEPKVVHITGGEPTIFWAQVKKIVAFVHKYKRDGEQFFIVIGTNAILLNPAKINFIAENDIKVIVSLDGKKKQHDQLRVFKGGKGSFDRVFPSILALKEAGAEVGLSMVIGKHNVNDLEEIISFFIESINPASLGVNFMKSPSEREKDFAFMISPLEYVEAIYKAHKLFRAKGLFMELPYRRLKPVVTKSFRYFDCGAAAGTTINIDSKGHTGPCKSFLIMEEVYSDQIHHDKVNEALQTFRKRSPLSKPECSSCAAIAICGNGCAYTSKMESGDYMAIDMSACEYSKLFHMEIMNDLFDLNKSALKNKDVHIITKEDRKRLLGKIIINPLSLASSIGHET